MAIWIITTGSSDVQLNTDDVWSDFYKEVKPTKPVLALGKDFLRTLPKSKDEKKFSPFPRALGLLYRGDRLEKRKADLEFPLLDTFCKKFDEKNPAPTHAIVLLTDQSEIFKDDDKENKDCPFWQDTCELQEILTHYFQKLKEEKNIQIQPYFVTIKPHEGKEIDNNKQKKGIDNWNEMLDAVDQALEEGLQKLKSDDVEIDLTENKTENKIYVSHQAGTPAISSAVQFLSISKFGNVNFLVSNQSYQDGELKSEADIIDSSEYWRGLQIQKAKKLIVDGLPGSALALLKESEIYENLDEDIKLKLQKLVDEFNIKPIVDKQEEFEPKNAVRRIRRALDLIEIFFEQENYIPGVALLAAAQETYMKAAIVHKIDKLTKTIADIPLSKAIEWDNNGLRIKKKNDLTDIYGVKEWTQLKSDIEKVLLFPNEARIDQRNINNIQARKWLENLVVVADFVTWPLLDWICFYDRKITEKREQDFRNQLMHNLRGVEKQDLIKYLYGYPKDESKVNDSLSVVKVYQQQVKQPFVRALKELGFPQDSEKKDLKQELKELAKKLDNKVKAEKEEKFDTRQSL